MMKSKNLNQEQINLCLKIIKLCGKSDVTHQEIQDCLEMLQLSHAFVQDVLEEKD